MSSSANVVCAPLAGSFGVEVCGVDLREVQSDEVIDEIRAAYWEHHLLVFRGKDISVEDQVRFAEWFGPVIAPIAEFQDPKYAEVETYMSNVRGTFPSSGEYLMHRDNMHSDHPCASMCLVGIEVSDHGGETILTNSELALARLPHDVRERLVGLRAIHIGPATKDDPTFSPDQLGLGFRATGGTPETRPHQAWPAVTKHPVTGVAGICMDPAMFYVFEGVGVEESDELAAEVWAVLGAPEISYRHSWSVGDTILWDNVSLLHAAHRVPRRRAAHAAQAHHRGLRRPSLSGS